LQDDEMDGKYRLFSRKRFTFQCCGNKIGAIASISPVDTDSGNEGTPVGAISPNDLIVRWDNVSSSSDSIDFTYSVKGKPFVLAEVLFWMTRPRTSVYIWHEVFGRIQCRGGAPTVTYGLTGSKFPSHGAWSRTDGILSATKFIGQGTFNLLWNPDPSDPTLVQ